MKFEWDDDKNELNRAKHGIGFELVAAFDWHKAILINRTRTAENERRYAAIGYLGRKLYTVIFTKRGARMRIISLRRSNRKEEDAYEITHA
jgi:uncharacterized DUF497 family protein